MLYCRNDIKFAEDPDYNYLRRLFKELYVRCGFENELIFDWTIQRYNPKFNQMSFGAQMGLNKGGSSGDSGDHSAEEEKVSLENKPPRSNEEDEDEKQKE